MPGVISRGDESVDKMIRIVKKQVEKAGVIGDLKKREQYEKPSIRLKRKSIAARKRKVKQLRKLGMLDSQFESTNIMHLIEDTFQNPKDQLGSLLTKLLESSQQGDKALQKNICSIQNSLSETKKISLYLYVAEKFHSHQQESCLGLGSCNTNDCLEKIIDFLAQSFFSDHSLRGNIRYIKLQSMTNNKMKAKG